MAGPICTPPIDSGFQVSSCAFLGAGNVAVHRWKGETKCLLCLETRPVRKALLGCRAEVPNETPELGTCVAQCAECCVKELWSCEFDAECCAPLRCQKAPGAILGACR